MAGSERSVYYYRWSAAGLATRQGEAVGSRRLMMTGQIDSSISMCACGDSLEPDIIIRGRSCRARSGLSVTGARAPHRLRSAAQRRAPSRAAACRTSRRCAPGPDTPCARSGRPPHTGARRRPAPRRCPPPPPGQHQRGINGVLDDRRGCAAAADRLVDGERGASIITQQPFHSRFAHHSGSWSAVTTMAGAVPPRSSRRASSGDTTGAARSTEGEVPPCWGGQ